MTRLAPRAIQGGRSLGTSWRLAVLVAVVAGAIAVALLPEAARPDASPAGRDAPSFAAPGTHGVAGMLAGKIGQPDGGPASRIDQAPRAEPRAAAPTAAPGTPPGPGSAAAKLWAWTGWLLAALLALALGGCLAALARGAARRRRLEAELARVRHEHDVAIRTVGERQALETLGRLTAGVAHDMGNVLQTVELYLRTIRDTLDDRDALDRLIDRASAAARRGSNGARDLLALARGSEGRPEPIDIEPLLGELGEVLGDLLGPSYAVRLRIGSDLPAVLAEAGDLEAMLINLATNARDAMAMAGSGELEISAELVGSPDGTGASDAALGSAWVRIGVADTGVGMDAQTLERAMDPFFTTKPPGRGTGLGLALAREFAERSGGFLRISSSPGAGTCVSLYLHSAPEATVHPDDLDPAPAAGAQGASAATTGPTQQGEQRHAST
jgi:signal transduction histidine kinase